MWWVLVGGWDRTGTVRSAVGLGWNGMQANDARAREGILRGAVCGLVCSQGHMGASQLEIELGRGRKTRWARASERKCGLWVGVEDGANPQGNCNDELRSKGCLKGLCPDLPILTGWLFMLPD